ncbi:MAG: hypothetical protein ABSE82_09890 [Nitrososphaerales archaeon]|jgi:hypothetical protein
MAKGPQQIQVLIVSNGTIGQRKVYDFGAFLALQVDKDKWMAWAKGKPLLVKNGFTKRYTYLLTHEIAWTLDSDSIVNIMAKAKALAYPKFTGVPGAGSNSRVKGDSPRETPELLPPEKPLTVEVVNGIIDERLNNGIRTLIHDEISLGLQSLKIPTVEKPDTQVSTQPSIPEQSNVKVEDLQKEMKDALDRLDNIDDDNLTGHSGADIEQNSSQEKNTDQVLTSAPAKTNNSSPGVES